MTKHQVALQWSPTSTFKQTNLGGVSEPGCTCGSGWIWVFSIMDLYMCDFELCDIGMKIGL